MTIAEQKKIEDEARKKRGLSTSPASSFIKLEGEVRTKLKAKKYGIDLPATMKDERIEQPTSIVARINADIKKNRLAEEERQAKIKKEREDQDKYISKYVPSTDVIDDMESRVKATFGMDGTKYVPDKVPHVSDINRSAANVDYSREAAAGKLQYERENPTRNMKPYEKFEYNLQKYNPLALGGMVIDKAAAGVAQSGAAVGDSVAASVKAQEDSRFAQYIDNARDALKQIVTGKAAYPGSQQNAVENWDMDKKQKFYLSGNTLQDKSDKYTEKIDTKYDGLTDTFVTKALSDLAQSSGYMIPTIITNAILPGTGTALLFASGYSSGERQALLAGGSPDDAALYGMLNGLNQSAGELIVGGVMGKGKGLLDFALKKAGKDIASKITNPAVRKLAKYAMSVLGEGAEEIAQGGIDVLARRATYEPDATTSVGELAYEGLLGAGMGAVFGAGRLTLPSVNDMAETVKTGTEAKEYYDSMVAENNNVLNELHGRLRTGDEDLLYNRLVSAKSDTEKSGILSGASDEAIEMASRSAEKGGLNILFYSQDSENGLIEDGYEFGGKLYVNTKSERSLEFITAHELTHTLQKSKHYGKLSQYVFNRMGSELAASERKRIADIRAEAGQQLKPHEIDYEIIADFAGNNLLKNEADILDMIRTDRTLGEKIRDWISDMIIKVKGTAEEKFLVRAKEMYEKALNEVRKADTQTGAEVKAASVSKLSPEQAERFKGSKIVNEDGTPKEVYHSTPYKFTEFNPKSGISWFSENKAYSQYYGGKKNASIIDKAKPYYDKKSKKLTIPAYLNIKNPVYLGDIDRVFKNYNNFKNNPDEELTDYTYEFIKTSGIPEDVWKDIWRSLGEPHRIYSVVNSAETAKMLKARGYDGIVANEYGNTTYGTLYPEQVKSVKNRKPTDNPDFNYSVSKAADTAYMTAVNDGDMETAQKMVDEAANASGYTQKKFHQTSADFHVFNLEKATNSSGDPKTPFGVFTKSTDKDIGLPGKKQMALYVKANNTFTVSNRLDIMAKMPEDFQRLYFNILSIRSKYEAAAKQAEEAVSKGDSSDDGYIPLLKKHKAIMGNWRLSEYDAIRQSKRFLTNWLNDNGYDSMEILQDEGTQGRSTDTFIALKDNQIKSAEPVAYDDDGNVIPLSKRFDKTNPDIRYSVSKANDNTYMDAVNRGDTKTAQRMVDEKAMISGITILDDSASSSYRVRRIPSPKNTVKAYKLFATKKSKPGELFPLFVGADTSVPQDIWLDAIAGKAAPDSKTGRQKVKSKLGPLAYRPGWHAGDVPFASHIGVKDADGKIWARQDNEVWAEVEVAGDINYQPEADANGKKKDGSVSVALADIKHMPINGMYRYKTNPNMTGTWIISGSMKINRVLTEQEVNDMLTDKGIEPMPWNSGKLDLSSMGLKAGESRNELKLLDAVTYDDNGEVIPLSKRFDKTNRDIRYSVSKDTRKVTNTSEDAVAEKPDERDKRIQQLEKELEKAKAQLTVTDTVKLRQSAVHEVALEYRKKYSGGLSTKKIEELLNGIYDYIGNGEDGHESTWEGAYKRALDAAESIAENATEIDFQGQEEVREIRRIISKTAIKVSQKNKSDLDGGYEYFRKKHFGSLRLTDKTDYGVDQLYADLNQSYPGSFPVEIDNPADQLAHIAKFMDQTKDTNYARNPFGSDIKGVESALATEIIDKYIDIPRAEMTAADKAKWELNMEKLQNQNRLAEQKRAIKKQYDDKARAEKKKADDEKRKAEEAEREVRADYENKQQTKDIETWKEPPFVGLDPSIPIDWKHADSKKEASEEYLDYLLEEAKAHDKAAEQEKVKTEDEGGLLKSVASAAGKGFGISDDTINPLELDNVKEMLATEADNLPPVTAETVDEYGFSTSLYSKGVTYNKDISRNLDAVAGKNKGIREKLTALIEKPFFDAKTQYAKEVESHLNKLHAVMKKLGIKSGSAESAAVQWIGEGYRQVKDHPSEKVIIVRYTQEDLRRGFPDTYKNINMAEKYCRGIYDSYIGRMNAMLEKIYPDALENAQRDQMKQAAAEVFYREQSRLQEEQYESLVDMLEEKKAELAKIEAAAEGYTAKKIIELEKVIYELESELSDKRADLSNLDSDTGGDMIVDVQGRRQYEHGINEQKTKVKNKISVLEAKLNPVKAELEKLNAFAESEINTLNASMQKQRKSANDYISLRNSIHYNETRLPGVKTRADKYKEMSERSGATAKKLQADIDSGDALRNKRLMPRKDYYHHFQEIEQGFGGLVSLISTPSDIDALLAGQSEYTKPKTKWAGFLQERDGNGHYTEDAIGGLLKYIPAAEYKINMDPIISAGREHIQGIATATTGTRNANGFLTWYMDFINDLAGKTNPFDRPLQKIISRKGIAVLKFLNSRVKGNAVVGNFRSAIAQFFNIPNAAGLIKNPIDWTKGGKLYMEALLGRPDAIDIIKQSGFLTERYLDSSLSQFDEGILKTPEKLMNWMMTTGDKQAAKLIWASAYEKAVRIGKANPIAYADDITRRSVAGRGIGEVPLVQKALVTQLAAPFQVEVNNAWQLLKDKMRDKDIYGIFAIFLTSWLMNSITRKLFGFDVSYDPINAAWESVTSWDEDETIYNNTVGVAGRQLGELVSNIPYGSIATDYLIPDKDRTKLFGDSDPTRYGTGNIGLNMLTRPLIKAFKGEDYTDDLLSAGLNIALPFAGRQTEKIIEGLQDYGVLPRVSDKIGDSTLPKVERKAGSYSAGGGLRFPAATDPASVVKSIMFGSLSSDQGKEYLSSGNLPLSEKLTAVYEEVTAAGADGLMTFKLIRDIQDREKTDTQTKAELQRETLTSAPLQDKYKMIIYRSMLASDSDIALIDALTRAETSDSRIIKLIMKRKETYNSEALAGEKALEWAHWVDVQKFTDKQKEIIDEFLPISASNYEKFTGAGLSASVAYDLADTLSELEPLEGKTTVSNVQKYRVIAESDLSAAEQMKAVKTIMPESSYAALKQAALKGLKLKAYVNYLEGTADIVSDVANGETVLNSKKKKTLTYIDKMVATTAVKDALYILAGYSENTIDDAPWRGGERYDGDINSKKVNGLVQLKLRKIK